MVSGLDTNSSSVKSVFRPEGDFNKQKERACQTNHGERSIVGDRRGNRVCLVEYDDEPFSKER